MMDLIDKHSDQVSETEEITSSQTPTPERILSFDCTYLKTCADCGTTKTPLWRSGPAGPKSLCNACGIRSRKKRRALMCPNKEEKKPPKKSSSNKQHSTNHQINDTSSSSSSSGLVDNDNMMRKSEETSFKRKLLGFGCCYNIPMQRPRSNSTSQRRRKIGEVEQAAFVLMALSCGTVYA